MIPKPLRDSLGFVPGPVEVEADGAALRVETILAEPEREERDGRPVIRTRGLELSDEAIRALRLADQR